jgi:glutamate synthase domain-containing protein 1
LESCEKCTRFVSFILIDGYQVEYVETDLFIMHNRFSINNSINQWNETWPNVWVTFEIWCVHTTDGHGHIP